jgi:hypothetical protein
MNVIMLSVVAPPKVPTNTKELLSNFPINTYNTN